MVALELNLIYRFTLFDKSDLGKVHAREEFRDDHGLLKCYKTLPLIYSYILLTY